MTLKTRIGDCYRYLHSWFGHKPSRFGWVIENRFAASGRLMNRNQLEWAVKHGIKSVVTIREFPLEPKWFMDQKGIEYRHVKVEDYGAPPVKELDKVVDYIDSEIMSGRPVIVHCNGGSGRTGTILAAYLMKKEHLTAEQAALEVKKIRGRTIRHAKQLAALKEYEALCNV